MPASTATDKAWELAALVFCMALGAVVGAFIPLPVKAEGAVACVIVGALLGAVLWLRRSRQVGPTVLVCLFLIVVGGPVIGVFLDVLHRYY